ARAAQLARSDEPLPIEEFRLRRPDGTYSVVEVLAAPFPFQGRRAVQVIMRDLSERKRSEQALRESERRFQLFMDNSPAVAWIKDAQNRLVYVSKPYEKALGRTLASIKGLTTAEIWPEDVARGIQ